MATKFCSAAAVMPFVSSSSSFLYHCVVPHWSLHLMEHKAKGRETDDHLLLSPLELNVTAWHTHTHSYSFCIHRNVGFHTSPPSTQILNSKLSKKLFFPVGQTLGELCDVYPIIVPDRWHQIKWKSTHTYICSRGRCFRDMRSTSGQQLDASNWKGFVSVALSSPGGNALSGLV